MAALPAGVQAGPVVFMGAPGGPTSGKFSLPVIVFVGIIEKIGCFIEV